LLSRGVPWTDDEIADQLGRDGAKLLAELLSKGVASRDERGVYCRRMVRDAHISRVRSEAGKTGGNPDLVKQKSTSSPPQNQNQNQNQLTTLPAVAGESEPAKAKRVAAEKLPFLESDLRDIYSAYPRHIGPKKAMEAIGRALVRIHARGNGSLEDPAEWLLSRVRAYSASPAGKAGQFTPHPTTWFNQERYDDDPAEWQRERDVQERPEAAGEGRDFFRIA
jgi:hypothetical protein